MMNVTVVCAACLCLYYCCAILFLRTGLSKLTKGAGSTSGNLKYSIVIAAHNEETNIEACLRSIFLQTLPADRYEVILVNDRSTDSTL